MTAGPLDHPLLGRLVLPADYVRVLATPMRLRSPHFAVHHVEGRPLPLKKPISRGGPVPADAGAATDAAGHAIEGSAPVTASLSTELSTGADDSLRTDVDDSGLSVRIQSGDDVSAHGRTNLESGADAGSAADTGLVAKAGPQHWLGLVVPKRHAKRAVTRTLVKRQIRNVAADCAPRLETGLWVVRQRSPFDPKQYPSAASDALKQAAREELLALFERAVRGERDRVKPRPPQGPDDARGKRSKSGRKTSQAAAAPSPLASSSTGTPAVSTPSLAPSEGPPCTP